MRFHLLFLALTSLFTPSISSPSDILYIQQLIADFALNLDLKNFTAVEVEFTPTATYNPARVAVTGIPNIKNTLATVVANNVTHTSLTTQSISLSPPDFDSQGAGNRAVATTYALVTFLGQGADVGKNFLFFGLWADELVKTGDFTAYGGWKFSARVFKTVGRGGDFSVRPAVLRAFG